MLRASDSFWSYQDDALLDRVWRAGRSLLRATEIPDILMQAVRQADHRPTVRQFLASAPDAIPAMLNVIEESRKRSDAAIRYEIDVDVEDGGPPITLYIRVGSDYEAFSIAREAILDWWYQQHSDASDTVLLAVLPGYA